MIDHINKSPYYKWWAFVVVAVGTFASVMDQGSVNVALPMMADYFQTILPTVQWVVIGHVLVISALLLPMGRVADLIGLKRVFILGSAVFIGGALISGSSDTLGTLIIARLVQGGGAAMTQGTGMAIVMATFPESERGKAIGSIMSIVGVGAIAGPAVGGFLVDALGWRSVFYANIIPVGISILLGLAILVNQPDHNTTSHSNKFDWIGAVISAVLLLVFLLTITSGHKTGWTSPFILISIISLLSLITFFIWWENRSPSPMLDLNYFKHPTFSFSVSAGFLIFLGNSAVLFLTPFYLQRILDLTPRMSGLVMVPGAMCMALLGPLSGRLSDRFGWRIFTLTGLTLCGTGLLILTRLTPSSSILMVFSALICHSSGMGIFYSPNVSAVLSTVSRARYGVVSAFLNLVRNAGNVASIAIATAIVTTTMGSKGYRPSLESLQAVDATGIGVAFTTGLSNAFLLLSIFIFLAMLLSAFKFNNYDTAQPTIQKH